MQLYPDIGLKQSHFGDGLCSPFLSHPSCSSSFILSLSLFWMINMLTANKIEHQKGLGGYLESVAKKHSFDPLQLSAWASFLSSQKISRFVYRVLFSLPSPSLLSPFPSPLSHAHVYVARRYDTLRHGTQPQPRLL